MAELPSYAILDNYQHPKYNSILSEMQDHQTPIGYSGGRILLEYVRATLNVNLKMDGSFSKLSNIFYIQRKSRKSNVRDI